MGWTALIRSRPLIWDKWSKTEREPLGALMSNGAENKNKDLHLPSRGVTAKSRCPRLSRVLNEHRFRLQHHTKSGLYVGLDRGGKLRNLFSLRTAAVD